jgi:hypothetical protein
MHLIYSYQPPLGRLGRQLPQHPPLPHWLPQHPPLP